VGVARNAAYATLDEETPAFAYLPLAQWWEPNQTLLVRATAESTGIARTIQEVIRTIDPTLPRITVVPLRQANALVLLPQRVAGIVTGALGTVGLLLAAVGLYGQLAYSASQRTREIGIRLALGAAQRDVTGLFLRQGLLLAVVGVTAGVIAAAALSRFMSALLFGVSGVDPITYLAVAFGLGATALLASYIPAARAARVDPAMALRWEQ
jgi:putative ABC transport system permease protein